MKIKLPYVLELNFDHNFPKVQLVVLNTINNSDNFKINIFIDTVCV